MRRVALLALVAGCVLSVPAAVGAASMTAVATPLAPAPGAAGQPLREPRVYASRHGVLRVTLVASRRRVTIAGRRVLADVYNGAFTAPTLSIAPGDRVRIRLVNHLGQATNLHFHGLEISPSGNADNVFVSVAPGHAFRYAFRLPSTAPTGTFWYHSHVMAAMSRGPGSSSEEQVFDGLSGLLEVRGLDSALPQRYLALRDVQVVGDRIASSDIDSAAPTTRLVDGQYQPRVRLAPGQTQLWHIANIGADIFYRLAVPGNTFTVVAQDGHPVNHLERAGTLLMPPGKRWDVLVHGGSAGSAPLQTLPYNEGDDRYPQTTLATVDTGGRRQRATARPPVIAWSSVDLARARVTRRRTIVLTENRLGTVFFVDGHAYDPSRIGFHARLGTVEQWTIVNHTDETHPFHMHTYPMQEISSNGIPIPFDGYQDEIVVPRRGYAVMRVHFTGFTGVTVFHCHILAHEDAGMMANLKVTR